MKRSSSTAAGDTLVPSKRQKINDPSWIKYNAFYEENRSKVEGPTPQFFGPPPSKSTAITYISSTEFDAMLPRLCRAIEKRVVSNGCDHVVLWLFSLGKSNFWITLKCWPYLREFVDEVRIGDDSQKAYGGTLYSNAHIYLDDAMFTGEQAAKYIIERARLLPTYDDGTSDHIWIVASLTTSERAKQHIELSLRYGTNYYEDVVEDEAFFDVINVFFVSMATLSPDPADREERYLFYSGFKVPDSYSIPLKSLVERGAIAGVSEANLSKSGIIKVTHPLPPYHGLTFSLKGEPLTTLKNLV